MLDDFRLRVFLTLAEECSFTRAAISLDVSQPAVSQNIAELERNLGVKLFDRQRGEVSLTPAGKIFKRYAEAILSHYSEASGIFVPLEERNVSVSASDEVYMYICDVLLKDFLLIHPEITLTRSTAEYADIVCRQIPMDGKRGIFALSSDPSPYFAGTSLWKILSYFLKPTLQ